MSYLDVLCVDGILGVGKTAQVIMFRNFLNQHKIPHKIITLATKSVEDAKDQLKNINQYLITNPDHIVICDGSIASSIVQDIADNMHSNHLWDKHKDTLQLYEELNSRFNFINIILTPNNLDMCDERLRKKANMSGQIKEELVNKERLMVIANGLQRFNNNILTYNIKINNINMQGHENITDIHKKILGIIGEKLQIKSPS